MEKSVDWQFDSYMQEIFQMKEVDIREYSPLALAYIGDCIFDLVIKSLVMNEGNKQVQKMHKETSSYVQASTNAEGMPKVCLLQRINPSQTTGVLRDLKR